MLKLRVNPEVSQGWGKGVGKTGGEEDDGIVGTAMGPEEVDVGLPELEPELDAEEVAVGRKMDMELPAG